MLRRLFDSGTLHQYDYRHLYPNDGSKIVARSTTQDRMLQSAEYFLAGFFGLQWPTNATLEVIIEGEGFNNSLAGYFNCPGSDLPASATGDVGAREWYVDKHGNSRRRVKLMFVQAKQISGRRSHAAQRPASRSELHY